MAAADSRRYPSRPLLGVGAILLDLQAEQVLLVQRKAPPARGLWTFPGGLVESGETLRRACLREVLEETGLQVELRQVALVAERILHDDRGRVEYHYLIVDFWGVVTGGKLLPASDASGARWVPLADLDSLPLTRGVPQAAHRAFQLARGISPATPLVEE